METTAGSNEYKGYELDGSVAELPSGVTHGVKRYMYRRPVSVPVHGGKLRRLVEDFIIYEVNSEGIVIRTLTIKAGFEWDGASIPRWYWWRYQPHDTMCEVASLVHDYLYKYGIGTREEADVLFRRLMLCEANGAWKSGVMYAGVRVGGYKGWDSDRKKQIAKQNSANFFPKKKIKKSERKR